MKAEKMKDLEFVPVKILLTFETKEEFLKFKEDMDQSVHGYSQVILNLLLDIER